MQGSLQSGTVDRVRDACGEVPDEALRKYFYNGALLYEDEA